MKAIVYRNYGSPEVLRLVELEKPSPKDNEVLIKIRATTVTTAECLLRKGQPYWGRFIIGFRTPRRQILGTEFAGDIEAIGKSVTRFKVGDAVYGFTGFRLGANAEYTCMRENASLAVKPRNLAYAEAAATVDGATTALFFLRDRANIQQGQKVLINGASGSIGTFAVQLARYFGAEVIGVCSSRNIDLVKSLGADSVIDYAREDFTTHTGAYDVIFDTVGKSSFAACKSALTAKGCYLPTTGLSNLFLAPWTALRGGKRVIGGMSVEKSEKLIFIRDLVEANRLKPIIDRSYSLEEIAEAHRYVDTGRKKGNVVITVA